MHIWDISNEKSLFAHSNSNVLRERTLILKKGARRSGLIGKLLLCTSEGMASGEAAM